MKATWDSKLYADKRAFEDARREDAERMERYEKKCAENAARIRLLEQEIASLKSGWAAPAVQASNHAPSAQPDLGRSSMFAAKHTGDEMLPAFMARLQLQSHFGAAAGYKQCVMSICYSYGV